jgi:DNA-binding MarR family transcriptional regulator
MMSKLSERQHAVNKSVKRTPAGDAFTTVVLQVLKLSGLLTMAGDELAKVGGQTGARWQVLAAIEHSPASVARISRLMGLARQSVQRIADLLERDGLASFEANPDHLRAKLLRLTPAGMSALRAIQIAQAPWADQLGAEIGENDLEQANAILERVLGALTACSDRGRRPASAFIAPPRSTPG